MTLHVGPYVRGSLLLVVLGQKVGSEALVLISSVLGLSDRGHGKFHGYRGRSLLDTTLEGQHRRLGVPVELWK